MAAPGELGRSIKHHHTSQAYTPKGYAYVSGYDFGLALERRFETVRYRFEFSFGRLPLGRRFSRTAFCVRIP
jgi:hypothetical protein